MKPWTCSNCGNDFLDGIKYLDEARAYCGLCVQDLTDDVKRDILGMGKVGPLTLEHERKERDNEKLCSPSDD